MLFGGKANPHFGPFHLLSFALIGGGFCLISSAWPVLYRAQREGRLATTGAYARVRHPQYVGFLFQWSTLLTLAMFPVLVSMYVRLARSEGQQALSEFGTEYRRYMQETPAFFPTLGASARRRAGGATP